MPMIDATQNQVSFPKELKASWENNWLKWVIRAEGVTNPGLYTSNNNAEYIHRMDLTVSRPLQLTRLGRYEFRWLPHRASLTR